MEDLARKGRLTEDQVRKVLNEILERTGQEPLTGGTTEGFLRQWLAGKPNEGTARRYTQAVNHFLKCLDDKAKAPITSLSHRDIEKFIEMRREQGVAPKTILIDVKTLNTALNLARRLGHIQSNPVEKALALHPIEVESSAKECFTLDQIRSLLRVATGDWRTMIFLGLYTGARLGDCAKMTWENVNVTEGLIDFIPQKSRKKNKRVVVPMHPDLKLHLEGLAENGKDEIYLCPSLAGKESGGTDGLSRGFVGIMRKANVDAQIVQGKGKRKFSKLSFHSLRHTFNSMLANSGIDQEVRMLLTGHSSVDINTGYTHMDLQRRRSAVSTLPALSGSVPDPNLGAAPDPEKSATVIDGPQGDKAVPTSEEAWKKAS